MSITRGLGGIGLGLVAGALGTVAHRAFPPWGLVAALALVLAVSVLARAWGGWLVFGTTGVGLIVTVMVLSRSGPAGDVLVPAGETIGWFWLLGSVVGWAGTALAPSHWFAQAPPAPASSNAPTEP